MKRKIAFTMSVMIASLLLIGCGHKESKTVEEHHSTVKTTATVITRSTTANTGSDKSKQLTTNNERVEHDFRYSTENHKMGENIKPQETENQNHKMGENIKPQETENQNHKMGENVQPQETQNQNHKMGENVKPQETQQQN